MKEWKPSIFGGPPKEGDVTTEEGTGRKMVYSGRHQAWSELRGQTLSELRGQALNVDNFFFRRLIISCSPKIFFGFLVTRL